MLILVEAFTAKNTRYAYVGGQHDSSANLLSKLCSRGALQGTIKLSLRYWQQQSLQGLQ